MGSSDQNFKSHQPTPNKLEKYLKNCNHTLNCHEEWRHQSRQEMLRDHRQQRSLLSEQEVAVALTS